MRRRSPPNSQAGGVSLFPFLAVLLCTMGALIVVLIVIARQARIQVAEARPDSPLRQELEIAKQDLQWRIDILRESRTKTLVQLDEKRQELSHLEDHSRRLRGQLEELEQARSEFTKLAAGGDVETDRLRREIDEMGTKISAKERELDEAIRKAGKGGNSYAVVPYHGPNETRRRPIYIECRADAVVLQPEGLVLTEKDFMIDLGPSNPLVSALRAAREYLARNQLPGEEGAPYPLVLVRPDGIIAYDVVMAAMDSWGSEFGYELVGADWTLDYPPPDPKLTLAMRQAISEGRIRQAYLAHAAPRLRHSGHHSFRASPTGGIMRDDGLPLGAESQLGSRSAPVRPSWAGGGRYGHAGASGGGNQAKIAKGRGGNPYASAVGRGDGAHDGSGLGGSGLGDGSAQDPGAGDLAAGRLNAARGSPTGVAFSAASGGGSNGGDSPLGSGPTSSALPGGGSLDGGGVLSGATGAYGSQRGAGGSLSSGQRYVGGGAGPVGLAGGNAVSGAAPGTRGVPGQRGRGWGGAQEQIDALASRLGAAPGEAPTAGGRGDGSLGHGTGGSGPDGSGPGGSGTGGSGTGGSSLAKGSMAAGGASGAEEIGPGKLAGAGPGGAGNAPPGLAQGASTGRSGNSPFTTGEGEFGGSGGLQRGAIGAKSGNQGASGSGAGPAGKPGGAMAGKGSAPGSNRGGQGSGGGLDTSGVASSELGAASGDLLAANAAGSGSPGSGSPGSDAAGRSASTGSKAANGTSGGATGAAGEAGGAGEGGGADGDVADANQATGSGGNAAKGGKSGNAAGSDGGSSKDAASGVASTRSSSKGRSFGGGSSGGQSGGSLGGQSGGQSGAQGMAGSPGSAMGGSLAQPQQGGMPMPIPMPNMTLGQNPRQQSIAAQRGEKNWANPEANRAASPVTRPIKIICDADHLTLLPEGRSRRGYKVIELGENREENVRELVSSVWDRIETWGVAGHGNYWRPELIMEVEPGAEERFRELKALLADSGLDVLGRPRSAAAVRYPRTQTPN